MIDYKFFSLYIIINAGGGICVDIFICALTFGITVVGDNNTSPIIIAVMIVVEFLSYCST